MENLTKEEKELIREGLKALPMAALMSINNDGTLDKPIEEDMKKWPDLVKSIKEKLDL